MKTPKNWRKGQTIFNFLEWLHVKKNVGTNQNTRMADPFGLDDWDWDKYFEEFLHEHNESDPADEDRRMRGNIGMLRQWLNEDRITDPAKMVTNEEIEGWLKLP